MSQNPPSPPAQSTLDCPLSSFEQGSVRDAVELEFDRALMEEKLKRGMHVSDEQEKRLRTSVIPSVFISFMEINPTVTMRELSDGERRMLSREMTMCLSKELGR